jgi:TPP-dependent pyruvate/acetoin dehydrogenase alpha subunit
VNNHKELLFYYQQMLLIRAFEEKLEELFTTGVCSGTVHTGVGQEAVAVGVAAALRKNDVMTSTHRGHGHFLARGGDPKRVMAEIFGKAAGYSGGRGGSQLMADYALGFMGANGIVGGSIPVATGMALHCRQQGLNRVVACFFGDGAVNQGTFHESLNLASLWNLPILYLCENNLYAMSMPVAKGMAQPDIAGKAANYRMPSVKVDGNDLLAVRQTVRDFIKLMERGAGPVLIEFQTYRFSGHSRGDRRIYRTREEENDWKTRDPIRRFRSFLRENRLLSAECDRVIRKKVRAGIREAVAFAKNAPWPQLAGLEKGVYA